MITVPPASALSKVIVASTRFKPAAHPAAHEIAGWFRDRSIACVVDLDAGESLRDEAADADLVVAIGGDGTILGIARALCGLEVPVVGLNIGKLGFLAEFSADDVRHYLDHDRGIFRVVPRLMLEGRVQGGEPHFALNDLVLTQGPMSRILEIEMSVDGRRATRYFADGVVVSTPVGSTAYSLSLGGPLLMPAMNAFVITPIAPHTLTNRPLVIDGAANLSFRILSDAPNLSLIVDGQELRPLRRGDEVAIRRAEKPFLLASHVRRSHFEVLRQKLHWAIRPTGTPVAPQVLDETHQRRKVGVVYLHGFASSPDGRKARYLSHRLKRGGVAVEVPDLNDVPGGFRNLTLTSMLSVAQQACARVRSLAGLPADAPIVVIGSSLGGYVASLLAAEDPSICGLVLLAPAFDFAERFQQRVAETESARFKETGLIDIDHHGSGKPETLDARGLLADASGYPAYPDVSCPTLVVHGRHDDQVPVSGSEHFANGHTDVHLLVLEDNHRLSGSMDTIGLSIDTFLSSQIQSDSRS